MKLAGEKSMLGEFKLALVEHNNQVSSNHTNIIKIRIAICCLDREIEMSEEQTNADDNNDLTPSKSIIDTCNS